jgi:hypothetical protein
VSESFLSLKKLVAPLRSVVDRVEQFIAAGGIESGQPSLRRMGAGIIAQAYGEEIVKTEAYIKVGELAWKSRGKPATYAMRPSASRVVEQTDLCSIPSEAPPMLCRPGIVEARRPETGERLWGDVVSLAWYQALGPELEPPQLMPTMYVIGQTWPNGIFMTKWQPAWTGEDLDDQLPAPNWGAGLLESVEAFSHFNLARLSARFLVILALLEQIEDGPLNFEVDKITKERQVRPRDLSAKGFKPPPLLPRPEAQDSVDPSMRVLADTNVRGHLRRFRVGKGREKIQWNYIHGHHAKRWFLPNFTVARDFKHPGLANSSLIFQPKKDG